MCYLDPLQPAAANKQQQTMKTEADEQRRCQTRLAPSTLLAEEKQKIQIKRRDFLYSAIISLVRRVMGFSVTYTCMFFKQE